MRAEPLAFSAIVVGLLARVLYWAITDRKFEDGLITVTHARNAVEGAGLTHHTGEPVTHGFTTAISVLVPLVGELVGEVIGFVDGFLALRLTSLVAFAVTIVIANILCRRLQVGTWPRAFVLLFLAIEYNQIFYGMAGMETQIAIAILLCAILATVDRRVKTAGVLFGLCFLVRPDFMLFVIPALAFWFFWDRREALKATGLFAAVVAPWLIFTTAYYGSPIPNTIRAKELRYHVDYPTSINPGDWSSFISTQVADRIEPFWHTFTPFLNNGFVTDAPLLQFFSAAIAAAFLGLCLVGVAVTWKRPLWRPVLVFLAIFTAYRLLTLPAGYYEWYYPPITAVMAILVGVGLTKVAQLSPRTVSAVAVAGVAVFAWAYPAHVILDERVQHDIEDKVRVPLGLWLRDNVPPGQTVTSESAGYVGYYGKGVKLYDYPGLTSKEAYKIMKKLGWRNNTMEAEIAAARPNFIVLRPTEHAALVQANPALAAQYKEVARFVVPPNSYDVSWHGVTYFNIDTDFTVYRRQGP